jgi:hypothetical protein
MIKRKVMSQIGNLIVDHKSFKNRGQMSSDWGMLYIIKKIFLRAIRYFFCVLKIDLISKRFEHPKFWDNMSPNFRTSTWES